MNSKNFRATQRAVEAQAISGRRRNQFNAPDRQPTKTDSTNTGTSDATTRKEATRPLSDTELATIRAAVHNALG